MSKLLDEQQLLEIEQFSRQCDPVAGHIIRLLLGHIQVLTQEVNILKEENRLLKEEVKQLKAKLNQNSSNSSKPPSQDGFKKLPNQTKSQREKSSKLPGGQKKHPGKTLKQIKTPDITHKLSAPSHCSCGCDLKAVVPKSVTTRQIVEIPEIKPTVTEYQLETKVCPSCQSIQQGEFPDEVTAPVSYGKNIKGFALYLMYRHHIPVRRTVEICADLLALPVSTGTLMNWSHESYHRLEGFEEETKKALKNSYILHADETGLRCEGKLAWLHSTSTEKLTLYHIDTKRGLEGILKAGVLKLFTGVIVHDCWAPYFQLNAAEHALCNSHILRELKYVAEELKEPWAHKMHKMLKALYVAKEKAQQKKQTRFNPKTLSHFVKSYRRVLAAGERFYKKTSLLDPSLIPKQRGRVKQSKGKNLLDRLKLYEDQVLRFLRNFAVPFTNNQAEQDIRMNKVRQKISGCFRSEQGAKIFCRIRGYLSTACKQGANLYHACLRLAYQTPSLRDLMPA